LSFTLIRSYVYQGSSSLLLLIEVRVLLTMIMVRVLLAMIILRVLLLLLIEVILLLTHTQPGGRGLLAKNLDAQR